MTYSDLVFLLSALFVVATIARIALFAMLRRWPKVCRSIRLLGVFLATYAVILIVVALASPRHFYAPGERRCFDDWCAAATDVVVAKNAPCGPDAGGNDWLATIEVSSVARRIRQRAADARAELEDRQGKRYLPCSTRVTGKSLSDALDPGESFRVTLPFRLPRDARPAGIVLHHGDFPGAVVIGADQSFLHQPALQRLDH